MYIYFEGYIEISFFFCFDIITIREGKIQKVNTNLFRKVLLCSFFVMIFIYINGIVLGGCLIKKRL